MSERPKRRRQFRLRAKTQYGVEPEEVCIDYDRPQPECPTRLYFPPDRLRGLPRGICLTDEARAKLRKALE